MKCIKGIGRAIGLGLWAAAGVILALLLFANVMIVEVDGSAMLPSFVPGQRLVVLRQPRSVEIGDVVVYDAPYYRDDGEGLRKVRRVTGSRGDWLRLDVDGDTVRDVSVLVRRTDILGKAVFDLEGRRRL